MKNIPSPYAGDDGILRHKYGISEVDYGEVNIVPFVIKSSN